MAQRAFTVIELLIVVAILGIMAAMAAPMFQEHSLRAKESVARDNLRILREAIGRYAAEHSDLPPGYPNNDITFNPNSLYFFKQIVEEGYISDTPENPFNNKATVTVIKDNDPFPSVAKGWAGWIYKPATKKFCLDWPGTDSKGIAYFDY